MKVNSFDVVETKKGKLYLHIKAQAMGGIRLFSVPVTEGYARDYLDEQEALIKEKKKRDRMVKEKIEFDRRVNSELKQRQSEIDAAIGEKASQIRREIVEKLKGE
jgi:hypothetical protein